MNSKSRNNSAFFYKGYYSGSEIDWADNERKESSPNYQVFKERNEKLLSVELTEDNAKSLFGYELAVHCFRLQTIYPGLLIGSGITHGTGLYGEIKLGFFFDHTTGLPVIPGSSVKGALRSVWPMGLEHEAQKAERSDDRQVREKAPLLREKATHTVQYLIEKIAWILSDRQEDKMQPFMDSWSSEHGQKIKALEQFIFGHFDVESHKNTISRQIIFHDAIPISTRDVKLHGEPSNRMLATDFITPHKEPLKNPVPIPFIKVFPGVDFRFQFELKDFPGDEKMKAPKLSSKHILELFKSILEDIGIGAKTNVGYGQFIDPKRDC